MDRISGADYVDIGGGKRGFADRDLSLGVAGTVLAALWANGMQEELIAGLIEASGQVPSAAAVNQVAKAIKRLAGGNLTALTASTALTPDHAGNVMASANAGNVTLTLPAANGAAGWPLRLVVARTDTSGNTLTIQPAGADTINGVAGSFNVPVGGLVELLGDGSSAWRIGRAVGFFDVRSLTATGVTSQTVPLWARSVEVELWGAGGGGGGCSAAGAARGGGGGEYRRGTFVVTPGASLSCTVGTGGIAGTNTPTSGGNGTSSSVGALITAAAGVGGGGSGGGVATSGGTGGTGGSGGSYAQPGADSQFSYAIGSSYNNSLGGGTFGAGYGAFVVSSTGNSGWAPGVAGNGGANGASLGGAGANGRIILTFRP